MNETTNRLFYVLQIADNALIHGHRISEWCGHGPILEQDIALTNTALDHIGQARSLYQYAADIFNSLPADERTLVFESPVLQQALDKGQRLDEDDIAYLRDAWDFRNVQLAEQPNKDWAYTIAHSFFIDTFNFFFYTALKDSPDETLAAIAAKSLKEVTYHVKWSSEWIIRLGDGTEESKAKMQQAINDRWMYTQELTMASEADEAMQQAGIGVDLASIRRKCDEQIAAIFDEATLQLPATVWMQEGGKQGKHTEHLGYILAEMQYMQRTYPGMEW